ncbi:DUF5367 family protein [Psychrobacillus psychrodurans]|uniref:DUF5367 family protein n=1 Tax=Psychrobacillus psychrodurans TaxID=126157 RepID=UPI0008ED2E6B|nr:DUF5367 family protein [Psychrobacillus psychrodurans]MCZ8541849.1 DUF5367 domain-containing protein [Psychrobacillus psychrodurans]SFN11894.1 hypothetical protein SAMN05421832_11560 [Psychrobacillus psychrodurans]
MINVSWGILLWVLATLLFRFYGQLFLIPGNVPLLIITFILTIPLIIIATYAYYYLRKIPESKRLMTSVQIALPGMILDIFSVIFFDKVFLNLHTDSLPFFASWLLWAYSLILISGFSIKIKSN